MFFIIIFFYVYITRVKTCHQYNTGAIITNWQCFTIIIFIIVENVAFGRYYNTRLSVEYRYYTMLRLCKYAYRQPNAIKTRAACKSLTEERHFFRKTNSLRVVKRLRCVHDFLHKYKGPNSVATRLCLLNMPYGTDTYLLTETAKMTRKNQTIVIGKIAMRCDS